MVYFCFFLGEGSSLHQVFGIQRSFKICIFQPDRTRAKQKRDCAQVTLAPPTFAHSFP